MTAAPGDAQQAPTDRVYPRWSLQVRYDSEMVECHLDAAWMVPGIGTVVGGHLMSGVVSVGDKLWFGPHQNTYVQVSGIRSSVHPFARSPIRPIHHSIRPSLACVLRPSIHPSVCPCIADIRSSVTPARR